MCDIAFLCARGRELYVESGSIAKMYSGTKGMYFYIHFVPLKILLFFHIMDMYIIYSHDYSMGAIAMLIAMLLAMECY